MQAWPRPDVPALPPGGGRPRVWDAATRGLREVGPDAGTARLYVCGITPYDATHLGHAHTYLAFDLLHRVWLDAGLAVDYAQNVTDVDDPLLERATATGVDWRELAESQVELFRSDMTALRVLPPDEYRGVVESMDAVVALVEAMVDAGLAYQLEDADHPDWYFSDAEPDGHHRLVDFAPGEELALFAERGGDPDRPGKRHPLDSLLWLAARPGEPSWPGGRLGPGRPGWHVECAAIALDALGPGFDVQGGGTDLAFPHHEFTGAQAVAVTGRPFAQAYVHAGMVGYDGEKMSKSRGNLVFVSRLVADGADPMAVRLALLAHHYRDDWEWTDADLTIATERLEAWRGLMNQPAALPATDLLAGVRAALRDDLDAPEALRLIDTWAAASSDLGGDDTDAVPLVQALVDALLGVDLRPAG